MKKLALLIVPFWIIAGFAQNSPTIAFSEENVVIDGKLIEPIWTQLTKSTGFYNYLPTDEGLAKNQTSVGLYHDGEYLYVGATYHDSVPRNQIGSLKRDDLTNSVVNSDTFVMILDTQNQQQSAYYFAVNIGGAQTDGLIERIGDLDGYTINTSWNAVWNAKTGTQGQKKTYEIKIPMKALNYNLDNPLFGVQFYVRDIKNNSWTILKNVKRNFRLFDLRFTEKYTLDRLPQLSPSRFALTPSITLNYQEDIIEDRNGSTMKPSLDVQYNLTSSLKLDATLNPDFSQIDVDQQVTNLTRFAVFFPERRNFFLENSDLFSNLGIEGVNPFYSRRIGADSDIRFGLKLSGNISPKTRLGLLNVQTNQENESSAQNYSTLVGEQQLGKNFTATAFLINRQETDNFNFLNEYNRVAGANMNYKSNNNKWIGLVNLSTSQNDGISGSSNFYNTGIWYNTRGLSWNVGLRNVGKNYLADVGFVPRLNNYDAVNDTIVREGYSQLDTGAALTKFYSEDSDFNFFRYLFANNSTYWDEEGKLNQSTSFYNAALLFKDFSAVYINMYHDYVNLKYAFDPLNNGNVVEPDQYDYFRARMGYNSVTNKKLFYSGYVEHGAYYDGTNSSLLATLNYRLLPIANISASYEINVVDLHALGNKTFHLARFIGEVFFTNRLNWTTYVQYNTQFDNFNINSRVQWEYKPLSYAYLVITNNHNQNFSRTNWGIAFKMNYRFDF